MKRFKLISDLERFQTGGDWDASRVEKPLCGWMTWIMLSAVTPYEPDE